MPKFSFMNTMKTLRYSFLFVGFFVTMNAFSSRFYVSNNLGADVNLPSQGSSSAPFKTLGFAITKATSGDTVVVLPGTYTETNIIVNKSLRIFGNESSGIPGIGEKPVFSGTASSANSSVLILQATNVEIRNLEIRVDQDNVLKGIFAAAGGFNGALIAENHIVSTKTGVNSVFGSYGIILGQNISIAGADSSLIIRNLIEPASGAAHFGRAIRLNGGFSTVGGTDIDDGNTLTGDYGIQYGSAVGGRVRILNNIIFAISAGIEFNNPTFAGTHRIAGNSVSPIPGNQALMMLEIKNHNKAGSVLEVDGNTFNDYMNFGVFSSKSSNVFVTNNTFNPADTARNFVSLAVNTKQQTTGTETASSSSISITGNNFKSAGGLGGTAISFQNHYSGVNPPFQNVVIGGAGALANTFGLFLSKVCELDARSGASNTVALWSPANYKITQMLPVEADFDLSQNKFDLGTGAKLPTSLSAAELMALEDRIQHQVDFDSLGFVTVIPNNVYVTSGSVVFPKTITPSLKRGLAAVNSDAWTITASPFDFAESLTIGTSLTLKSEPAGEIGLASVTMDGAGKTLSLKGDVQINSSLNLNAGNIDLGSSNLSLANAASGSNGSASSYVVTSGTGKFVRKGLGSAFTFPIGTASAFTPTILNNTGTADDIGLRVQNDVLSAGLTGSPVDSVVGVTWVINEATTGGSNLNVTAQWPGSAEKAGFNRGATFFQGFAGSWTTLSGSAVAATGTGPFTASYTGIAGNLIDLPLRVANAAAPVSSNKVYYVSATGGDDSRTLSDAKNPSTPWSTIAKALSSLDNGDSLQVLAGTYSESNLAITKGIKIFGNVVGIGSGAGAGTGVKPVLNGTVSGIDKSIFVLKSTNIEIRNFEIRVNQDSILRGIFAAAGGFNGAVIAENHILSTKTGVSSVFGSYGIILGQNTSTAGNDSSLIIRNVIEPATGAAHFGRAIRLNGGASIVGGTDPADGNTLTGDYGVQFGSPRFKASKILNNTIFAISAGIEFNNPTVAATHRIAGNTISPIPGNQALMMVEIKNHNKVGSILEIDGNTFNDYMNFGLFSSKSANVFVTNNTFNPADTARNFVSLAVNTKQQTTGTETASASSITITGNDFKSAGGLGGTAISFQNHFSGANPPFQNVVVGGSGALINKFGLNYAKVFELDARSGASNTVTLWSPTNYKITQMRPVEVDFDISQNEFDLGSGGKLPTSLSASELMALEDKIQHQVDFDSLGFVTVVSNNAFVTSNSFISPKTTSPSLNRAVAAVNSDSWTITASPINYAESVSIDSSLTLKSEPAGEIGLAALTMDGAGKTLSLNSNVLLSASLNLNAGNIDLGLSNLSLANAATGSNGSESSYVVTSGSGKFVRQGLGSSFTYPIGTAAAFTPTILNNTGTADDIGLRVQNDVLSAGLTGNPVDSVVGVTWVINEAVTGGSNLDVTAQWPGSSEKAGFNRTATFFQGFAGSWTTLSGSTAVAASGTDPYTSSYTGIAGDLVELPLRISSSSTTVETGNLYYVSNATGDDSRSPAEAKNPATPWLTIGKAVSTVNDGDSVQVLEGTYAESNIVMNRAVNLFGNVPGIGTGVGAGTGARPVVNGIAAGTDSSIFLIRTSDVLIRNFQIEVDQLGISHGIYGDNGNYNNLRVSDCRIFSTGTGTTPCVRFNTYGMRFKGGSTDSVIVKGTNIEPRDFSLNCAFGRGIRTLGGGRMLIGGPSDADTNRIVGLYGVQFGDLAGASIIQNNTFFGQGVEITAPASNSGVHQVIGNRVLAVLPSFFTTLVEFKDVQNDGTGILLDGNLISGHSNIGVFSTRSKNITVSNNTFRPSAGLSDTNFVHILVNTKQQTRATVQNPGVNEISIQGNDFQSALVQGGSAIVFANHNDDAANNNAFGTVTIGGADPLANQFGENFKKFISLDEKSGPSSSVSPWQTLPLTTMAPVADNFDASANEFSIGGAYKLPADMNADELFVVEDKIQHGIDFASLGFVTIKSNSAFVTNKSFLSPFTSTPSLQRAGDKASDNWTINIQPNSINEIVEVDKNLTWDTHPADSVGLLGISMKGTDKVLVIADNVILSDSLKLDNAEGGKIKIGDKNLIAKSSAIISGGADNSYVITDGLGSFVVRGLGDQVKTFPVGTLDAYAPVSIDDAVNTGDNFRVRVAAAATGADFTPALPTNINSFVKFQWTICEDVAGGSDASLNFDWRNPINVQGTDVLNSFVRNDGTSWVSGTATIAGQTASASNVSNFCSPFAIVANSTVSIITGNPLNGNTGLPQVSFCPGDTILVPFTATGPIVAGNQFTVVLSDATGSFATGGTTISLSPLTGTSSDTILAIIPVTSVNGINYHIRVDASTPDSSGLPNTESITIFSLPEVPVISGDLEFCLGGSVQLSSSSAAGYLWSPNGEITQNISVSSSGTFTVKVTDSNGCSNISVPVNTVATAPPVAGDITFSGTLVRCAGDSIILTANPAGLDYKWQTGNAADTLQNLTIKASGSFSVIVLNPQGCSDTSASVNATFNTLPAVPVVTIANDTVCQPASLDFGTAASAATYEWSGTGITPSPSTQAIQIFTPGAYTVSVKITDGNGCSSTSLNSTGLVKKAPVAPAIIPVGSGLTRCADDTLVLSPSPFNAINTYNWQPLNSGVVINGLLNIVNPGTYSVSLSVDSNGCTTSANLGVLATLNPLPEPVISTSEPDNRVCIGDSITLTSNFDSGNLWIGAPGTQTSKQIVLSASLPSVVLQVTDVNGCVNTTDPIVIQVDPLPVVTLRKDSAFIFQDDIVLQAVNFSSNAANFGWYKGSELLGNTGAVPTFSSPAQITSIYSVILTDVNGCQSSDSILVRVSKEVFVPNSFSPNKDGKNDYFKVYGFGVQEIQFQVWDRLGNLVYESSDIESCVESGEDNESAKGWNGEYKGKLLGQGSFIWTVKGKFHTGEDIKVVGGKTSGSVTLLN